MNCESVREQLDQFLAGRLEPAAANAIRGHLAQCTECRADEEAARFLAPRVSALPRSVPPTRPLWDGIQARLSPRRARRLSGWLPLAAGLALLAGAGWWQARSRQDVPAIAEIPQRVPIQAAAYRLAASDLETSLLKERKLEPGTATALRRDLATMNSAIEETSSALESDPGNEVIQQLHLSALRRKLDVLRRAAALYAET